MKTKGLPDKLPTKAPDIVRWGIEQYGTQIALACSFSPEDVVIAHMMQRVSNDVRIFAIDTGRLHEETYQCAQALVRRLGIPIQWYFPRTTSVEDLVRKKGQFSFYNSLEERHECCFIRKVEPLTRALRGLDGWFTGLRREQGVTRKDLSVIAVDDAHDGIMKVAPLAEWSQEQVDAYISKNNLPENQLLRKGYTSIGCAPCTRPVAEGADPRSGRWWWESSDTKECGLHTQKVTVKEGDQAWTI